MKILLVAPYVLMSINKREDFIPSSALVYLAAALRKHHHEPILLDLNTPLTHQQPNQLEYGLEKIFENIRETNPPLIGFNCLFSGVFPTILSYVKSIKLNFPNIKIAIGGIHPTTFYERILNNCKEIDYIVIGEGESQIVKLAESIENSNYEDLYKINSFAFRNNDNKIIINLRTEFIHDLDTLGMPAWDLLDFKNYEMDFSHYYNPKKHIIRHRVPIFSSRGCPFDCNFCDMFLMMGKNHRRRSPKNLVDEMHFLNENYGSNYFSFMDDNLTLNKKHILSICNEIEKQNIDIQYETPNGVNVNSLDEEIISAMANTGLIFTSIAIEHGSDYIRNKIVGKNLSREKIYEIVALLKKYKIMTRGFFIIGFPEETNETLEDTYKMMSELKLDLNGTMTLIPFPGTKLFEQAIRDELFIENVDLDNLWNTPISLAQTNFLIKPYNMSIDELEVWQEKLEKLRCEYLNVDASPVVYERINYTEFK